jgi:hypothetical protein
VKCITVDASTDNTLLVSNSAAGLSTVKLSNFLNSQTNIDIVNIVNTTFFPININIKITDLSTPPVLHGCSAHRVLGLEKAPSSTTHLI